VGVLGVIDFTEYEAALNSPTIWRTILWILYSTSIVLFIILVSKAVQIVHRLKPWPSFVVGLTSYVVYQVLFLVFNR
jgi:hypothetical protein